MKLRTHRNQAVVLCAVMALAGCADDSSGEQPSAGTQTESAGTLPQGSDPVSLDPADFSTEITNTYWPMKPGARWTSRETDGHGEVLDVVVTVTSATRKIANGITARVVRDTVSQDGEVVEDTFDWYAQDSGGNIWYLGEDTAEFEDGKVSSREGSFEAGVDGALPGVAVPGKPTSGLAYRQEFYRGEAEDNGEVLSTHEMADVPAGHYDGLLLTRDTATIEPNVLEYKLYAPGVGPVLVFGVSGGAGREELLSMSQVSAAVAASAAATPLGRRYP